MPVLKLKDRDLLDLDGIHYYGGAYSNNCMRVAMHLEEKGLSWTTHGVNLSSGAQFEPEYLRIHPNGAIPALVHNGNALSNSNDIMRYIEENFPSPSLLPEGEDAQQEAWREVDEVANSHFKLCKAYFYSKGMGRPCSDEDLERYKTVNKPVYDFHMRYRSMPAKQYKQEVLKYVEAYIQGLEDRLQHSAYLCGDSYSVVDIAWLGNLCFLEALKFDFKDFPSVRAWMETIKQRPAYNKKTQVPHIPPFIIKFIIQVLYLIKKIKGQ